jgi:hypothetical protein
MLNIVFYKCFVFGSKHGVHGACFQNGFDGLIVDKAERIQRHSHHENGYFQV